MPTSPPNRDPIAGAKAIAAYLPSLGIAVFFGLYGWAATIYPGGSQADPNTVGFDWIHNYWCNLTNAQGINGLDNPARPVAVLAMLLLCGSLTVFFFQFSLHFEPSRPWKILIPGFGTASMACAALVFTPFHDSMTLLSSIFGAIAVLGMILSLYRSDLTGFKASGAVCLLLLATNNAIYHSGYFLAHLPLVQKGTFVVVLAWIAGLNLHMQAGKSI